MKDKSINYFKQEWDFHNNFCLQNKSKTLDDLLTESSPIKTETFDVKTEIIYDLDLDFEINTTYGKSSCWLAESVNNVDGIWHFLEDLIEDKQEYFFYCEEEGPYTFFYASKINNDYIRFVHITDMLKSNEYTDSTGEFRIVQDIVVNRKTLINAFYNSIKLAYDNYRIDYEVGSDLYLWVEDSMKNTMKDSEILRNYLML